MNGNPVSGVDPSGTNEENVVDQEQKNVNRVSTSEKNIQQDDHHSISNEMIKKINEFGWYTGAVCFDLAVAAAEDAASQKYTGAHVGRVKDKKDYAIGGVWKEAPKQPKNYRNLSIRKGVAENMLSYIKASIDKDLPVVVGVSIGIKAEDENGRMINEGVTEHFLVLTSYDVKDGKVVGFSGIDNSDHKPPTVNFTVNEKTGAIEKAKPKKITADNRRYVDSYKYTVTQVRLWKGVEGLKPMSSKGVW